MSVDKLVDSAQLDADLTSVANAIRAKSGGSGSLSFPSGFISEIGNISGGGGSVGGITVASGSFAGSDPTGGRMYGISLGAKMPQTDFYIQIKAKNGEEIERNSDYTFVLFEVFIPKEIGYYDLSATGNSRPFVSSASVDDNNSGTVTAKSIDVTRLGAHIRNGSVTSFSPSTFNLHRTATAFTIDFGQSNGVYKWPSTVTYEFKVVYFGNSSSTDIIDLS